MRRLPVGVAISMIVHAGLVAYVAPRSDRRRHAPPVAIEVLPVPPRVEAPLMEVTLFDEPAAAAPAPSVTRTPAARASAAIATTPHPATGGPIASDTPPAATPGTSLLAMRHGEAPHIALPAGMFDNLDHVPRGTAPEIQLHSGKLDNDGAGKKSDQGVFDAKVAADGTVTLTDKPNIGVTLAAPNKRELDDWLASDKFHPPAGDPAVAAKYQAAPGTTINLGSARKDDDTTNISSGDGGVAVVEGHPGRIAMVLGIFSGHFDATDALMRSHGMDPYFERKLKFLDTTRDERVQLGNRTRAAQLAHSPQLMQRNLAALWAAPGDLAAKKRALFELWDECAETGDAPQLDGAASARRLVIGFIRGHLPANSPDAYTPAELADLARHQQSTAAFRPYDD